MGKKLSIGDVICILLMGIYPFVMTNGYHNVTWSKYVVFMATVLFASILFLGKFYISWMKNEIKVGKHSIINIWNNTTLVDKAVCIFFLASFLTFLFSNNKKMVFSGAYELNMGFSYTIVCILLYIIIRKCGVNTGVFLTITQIVAIIEIIFTLLQFFGVDFFGMIARIQRDQQINYISTWGNTAVYGIYLVLISPIAICPYCTTSEKWKRLLSGVTCFFVYIGILTSNTDATYLGVFVVMIGILFYCMKSRDAFMRFSNLLCLFGISGAFFRILFYSTNTHRPVSSLGKFAMSVPWCLFLLVMGVLLWCLLRFRILKEKSCVILSRVMKAAIVFGVIVLVLSMVYFSVINREMELGRAENYIRFSKAWGTERGYVWSLCLSIFGDFTWIQKIFGMGQGTVSQLLLNGYGAKMLDEIGYYFDNAHNVYIHQLLSIGIVGVMSYLGVVASVWKLEKSTMPDVADTIKNEVFNVENIIGVGCFVGFIAAAIVDIVSIYQPLTQPITWMYLAIFVNIASKNWEKSNNL